MLTKEELQRKLKPIVIAAGRNTNKFADLALPIMLEHMEEYTSGENAFLDEAFDHWNCAIVAILEEIKSEGTLH